MTAHVRRNVNSIDLSIPEAFQEYQNSERHTCELAPVDAFRNAWNEYVPRSVAHDRFLDFSIIGAVPGRDIGDSDGLCTLENNTRDASVGSQVKVGLHVRDAVYICYPGALAWQPSEKELALPVAASLRRPVCRLMYFAQISAA